MAEEIINIVFVGADLNQMKECVLVCTFVYTATDTGNVVVNDDGIERASAINGTGGVLWRCVPQ